MRKNSVVPISAQYCSQCGAMTASNARFCQACGASVLSPVATAVAGPPSRSRNDKTRWKGIWVAIIVILILGVFGSRNGDTGRRSANVARPIATNANSRSAAAGPTARPAPTSTPRPTPTPLPGTKENPAPFSQPLTGGGATVELLSGRFANKYGYSEPKGGYKYLVIDTRIEGAGSDDHHFSSSNFSGEDADTGAGYDSAFVIGDNALGSDNLSRSEYVSGTIALEVQETAERVIVKYDPKQFDEEDLYWLFP
jgi:hypothetical protein